MSDGSVQSHAFGSRGRGQAASFFEGHHDEHATMLAAIHDAEVQIGSAEANAALFEARLRLADGAIARVRACAERAGIRVSQQPAVQPNTSTPRHMSIREFAAYMGVSERLIASRKKALFVEGIHFHGIGRRIVIHVAEASELLRTTRQRYTQSEDLDQLAIDEVTRRRAHVALQRARRGAA